MKVPSVKGFHDILPGESGRWAGLEATARRVFAQYNYHEIRIPIVERAELFRRSVGETSDIVEKEMYAFADRDGTPLTLRPEGTASVVRAYVEHALHAAEPVAKLYYFGPMFRRERPQRGRLRQFSQIGAELIGRDDPAADAEVLLLLHDLLRDVGVDGAAVHINSLGDRACRPAYREALVAWGGAHVDQLCADCRRRLEQNPLRLLDCKQPGCVALRDRAPRMLDHLCDPCRAHFDRVLALLAAHGVRPHLQPYMVRGLDYYCRTAFEVVAEGLGAQNALGGGGRYDGLVKDLGGPDIAGVGFALGVERLAMVLGDQSAPAVPEFVIAPLGAAAEVAAATLAHRLRRAGARVEVEPGERSLKSQMRHAGKLGARYVVLLGEDELASGRVTVRDMTERRDLRQVAALDGSAEELRAALAAGADAGGMERHA
ncbi:histidine--tRNA ligase [bacterium]|nr:histidine--tRNA ligase [bacterium]